MDVTQEQLISLLDYNPDTGDFIWKVRRPRRNPGDVAGSPHNRGYHKVAVAGKYYQAHRLAFLFMTGDWPTGVVDHINGNKLDNRWENIRDVTQSENMANQSLYKSNKSGVPGVTWDPRRAGWIAIIKFRKETRWLGFFCDWFEAVCARKSAEINLGFHENHGRAA